MCKRMSSLVNYSPPGSTNFVSTHLKSLHKFSNSIGHHFIISHCSDHEFVSDNNELVIYRLLHCQKLNLLYIIIQNMIASTTCDYKRLTIPMAWSLPKSLNISMFLWKMRNTLSKSLSSLQKTFPIWRNIFSSAHYECPSIFIPKRSISNNSWS